MLWQLCDPRAVTEALVEHYGEVAFELAIAMYAFHPQEAVTPITIDVTAEAERKLNSVLAFSDAAYHEEVNARHPAALVRAQVDSGQRDVPGLAAVTIRWRQW